MDLDHTTSSLTYIILGFCRMAAEPALVANRHFPTYRGLTIIMHVAYELS